MCNKRDNVQSISAYRRISPLQGKTSTVQSALQSLVSDYGCTVHNICLSEYEMIGNH